MRFAIEKSRQWWIFAVVLFAWCAASLAQVVPPFASTQPADYLRGYHDASSPPPQSTDYQRGLTDGKSPFVPPVMPTYSMPVSDKSYTIGPGGFATLSLAVTQAQRDGSHAPAFLFVRGQTYTLGGTILKGTSFANCTSVTFDATGTGTDPIINASDIFLNLLSVPSPAVRGLAINCLIPFHEAGVRLSSCPNAIVAGCTINGYIWGIEAIGGGNVNVRIIGNTFTGQSSPFGQHGAPIYTQGTSRVVIAGNYAYRAAWMDKLDPTNSSQLGIQSQSHGLWYGNETGSSDDVTCIGNIVLDCGGSAIACRNAGEFAWNVIRGGSDSSIIVQSQSATQVYVHDNFILGPVVDAAPNYGTGIKVLASNAKLLNNYFSSNALAPPNSAVIVQVGPFPSGVVSIDGLHGWWPRSAVSVLNRPVMQANVNIVLSNGAMPVAKLTDFYGVPEAQVYATVKASDAPRLVDWMRRSVP